MTIHHFKPVQYWGTFGPHPPALRVASGDTVVTTTVDARGYDAAGEQVTARGNPQTGPFYVEGAEPGDTLAVHIEHAWPNRTVGWTANVVAPNVLDPGYTREVHARGLVFWDLDLDAGTARVQDPVSVPALRKLALPLQPMLGCLGVAPPDGQAISTGTSGPYGGNMDYRGYVAGVIAYFPVFEPGALFHLGDGHAIQGDGEIVGTGIETSFDVRFRVWVLKGQESVWPRGENEDWLFTVGNARPLDQAVQHATTEMLRWLQADWGLDATSAHTLLGQVVAYDLGNMYDPAYTMVCKAPKAVPAQLRE